VVAVVVDSVTVAVVDWVVVTVVGQFRHTMLPSTLEKTVHKIRNTDALRMQAATFLDERCFITVRRIIGLSTGGGRKLCRRSKTPR